MLQNAIFLRTERDQAQNKKYYCQSCDYASGHIGHWNRHVSTKRHEMLYNATKKGQKGTELIICKCGKSYKHPASYYRHKKKCDVISDDITTSVMKMVKAQANLNKDLIDAIKNVCTNTTNIQTQNNTNVMIYLNDFCSNAMSLQEFADKLSLTLSDLNKLKVDKSSAIADIVKFNLAPLAITERPVHNNDKDWYINDKDDGWLEDSGDKMLKTVERGLLKNWSKVYEKHNPDWINQVNKQTEYINLTTLTTSDIDDKSKCKIKKKMSTICKLN